MKLNPYVINTGKELESFCKNISEEEYIAIDTEFVRKNTFFPIPSLIQVASKDICVVIDLLKIKALKPIYKILNNPNIIKVFHSARQDLEIFFNLFNRLPKNIFDTQIANSFLDLEDQISYEKLVLKYCNKKINKNLQFTDWSLRPLSNDQIIYAKLDVYYLRKIYPIINSQLNSLERIEWVKEETLKLLDLKKYKQNPKEYWKKINDKCNENFSSNKLKIFFAWRETKCMQYNIPRNFFLNDQNLLKVIKNNQKRQINFKDKNFRFFSQNDVKEFSILLKKSFKKDIIKKTNYIEIDQNLLNSLKILLTIVSLRYKISQNLISKTSELKEIISEKTYNSKIFTGWRNDIFGCLVKEFLEGKIGIRSIDGKINYYYT